MIIPSCSSKLVNTPTVLAPRKNEPLSTVLLLRYARERLTPSPWESFAANPTRWRCADPSRSISGSRFEKICCFFQRISSPPTAAEGSSLAATHLTKLGDRTGCTLRDEPSLPRSPGPHCDNWQSSPPEKVAP